MGWGLVWGCLDDALHETMHVIEKRKNQTASHAQTHHYRKKKLKIKSSIPRQVDRPSGKGNPREEFVMKRRIVTRNSFPTSRQPELTQTRKDKREEVNLRHKNQKSG